MKKNMNILTPNFSFIKGIFLLALIFFLFSKSGFSQNKDEISGNLFLEDSLRSFEHFVNADLLELMGQKEQALQEYQKALEILPDNREIRFSYAQALFRMRKYAEAIVEASKIKIKDADTYFLLGESYRFLGEIGNAKQSYENTVLLDSNNVQAYSNLALIYQRENKLDAYISAWKNVARLMPLNTEVRFQLVQTLVQLGNYPEALTELDKVLLIDSGNRKALYLKAEIFQKQNNLPLAIQSYEQLLKADSTNIDWNQNLLDLYFKTNNLPQAISILQRLNSLHPEEDRFKEELAGLYISTQKYQQADSILVPLVNKKPDDFFGHYLLGKSKQGNRSLKEAEIEFKKAVALNDSVWQIWTSLVSVYVARDSLKNAVEALKQALEKVKEKKEVYFSLGLIYSQMKDYNSAIENLSQAIKLDPQNKYYYFQIGAAYEQSSYFASADSSFQKALQIDSSFADALNYLGYMYADSGINLETAKYLIEKALLIFPENGAYLDSYGWVLFKLGDLNEAEKKIRKALSLMPEDPLVIEHLGDILEKQGRIKEAVAEWEKALKKDVKNERVREKVRKFGVEK
jgi:tetratricopeptide (TPR) repeat protein